ncbi:ClpXP protease specificity-enhancing factor SspB [Candidatus Cytomitobacter indipagum]|nr:ClpXP protease specificity-enhancing factor SspB [Candidatus Cytomitobacter indipagum]
MQNYKKKLQEYLRLFVRDILRDVIKHGLQGEQHLYIAFSTKHPNVSIPDSFKEKYPKTMTIVLQNEFENLEISNQGFSVNLTFSGIKYDISVPFNALMYITDPSDNFSLEFSPDLKEIPNIDEIDVKGKIIYFDPHLYSKL